MNLKNNIKWNGTGSEKREKRSTKEGEEEQKDTCVAMYEWNKNWKTYMHHELASRPAVFVYDLTGINRSDQHGWWVQNFNPLCL